ncbi:MAG: hypothetical protein PHD48_04520 [Alphaproteobacteria bacterium]|nr:hypothetical protein [Alphaproteobacteria bacterium]
MKKAGSKIVMAMATVATLTSCGVTKTPTLPQEIPPGMKPVTLSREAVGKQAETGSTLWSGTNRVTEKDPQGAEAKRGPLTNAAHTVLDGLNQITTSLDITHDPDAAFDPDEGLGRKALGAVVGVVGVAYKPADVAWQIGGNLFYDVGQDVGVVPKILNREPPKSESRGWDTLENIGHNIYVAPIEVPKNIATGAWLVVSGVASGLGHLLTAPFGGDEPEAELSAALPKPRHPNHAGMKNVAAATQPLEEDSTFQNSMGSPKGITPIGVRALSPVLGSARFYNPGGPG